MCVCLRSFVRFVFSSHIYVYKHNCCLVVLLIVTLFVVVLAGIA